MRDACVLMLLAWTVAGCASAPGPRVEAVPIDLSPRCEPRIGSFAGSSEDDVSVGDLATVGLSLPRDARLVGLSSRMTPLDALAWGFSAPPSLAAADLALVAALLQSGETTRDPAAFRGALRSLGATAAARIEDGWLWLELHHPRVSRTEALALFEPWLAWAAPDADAFTRTRRGVSLTRLAAQASATEQAARLFEKLRPSTTRPARRDQGTEPVEASAIPALLAEILRPEGSVVVWLTSGDLEGAEELRETFGGWIAGLPPTEPMKAVTPASDRSPATPFAAETIHVIDRPGSPQVELLVGHPTVGPDHADFAALRMLASLLGHDVGGRLFRDLRERLGLAYIVTARQEPEGRLVVSTRARPARAIALLAGIEAHLEVLASAGVLPCEAEMLRSRMAGALALLADEPGALLADGRQELAWRGEVAPLSERRERFGATDVAALEAASRRHLAGRPTVVLVGDAAALARDIARALPDREIRVYDASLEAR